MRICPKVALEQLSKVRKEIRNNIHQDKFSIPARFSGGICICGQPILMGEEITKPYDCRWLHTKCAELDRSDSKVTSYVALLTDKLAQQAIEKQALWKDDLLELAQHTFLGEWSKDYWLEDIPITVQILDQFGLHTLTRGWRFSSEKTRQKYAQKIEKEFAKRKGWICRICRRLIWVEKSVERGIGPICYKHQTKLLETES